jgi:5,10-methylenetetrahydromethanopterin reductase
LPLLFPAEHYNNILPYVREGLAQAGRALEDIDLAACVWCSVSDNREAALDVLRAKIAYYGHAMGPLIHAQLGLTAADFAPIEHAIMVENDEEKAKKLVTEPMLAIGIVGTPRELIARLEKLVALGVRHLSFGPPLGPDPIAAVQTIGREVIPYFR